MFRKYEKTFRIQVPQFDLKSKFSLSKEDTKLLLGGKITVTEKLDGANTGIIRHKDTFHLQKRGSLVGTSEHLQFGFFKNWSSTNYEKIMKIPENYIVYTELLFCVHTVFYNQLPDYVLVFAIYDKKKNRYLEWDFVENLCAATGLQHVPLIGEDIYRSREHLFELIPDKSDYGSEPAEGIVIWNYKHQLRGKLVRPEFVKRMEEEDEHWTRKEVKINELRSK